MKKIFFLVLLFFSISTNAQKNYATIKGIIIDENDIPISNVSVVILGKQKGITSSENGSFIIKYQAEKHFALSFSHTGYNDIQKEFYLSKNQEKE